MYASKLAPSFGAMLRVIATGPAPLDRHSIADRAGISRTSSGLGVGLGELVSMSLVERLADGRYRLSPDLRG